MASEPLPDHYKALGVDKNADSTTIKANHRKLVLKCHPDKVTDPALKQQKQEEFHKIQQAYEILIDQEKRADYDAHLTLEALRREKAARGAAASSAEKTARFDVRTSGGASFSATGPSRYATEERKPSRSYDEEDRYYEERSRSKYDTYPAYPKTGSTPRSSRSEKESSFKSSPRTPQDRTRSDRNKTRDRESRSDRKFVSVESESSSDEKARYEADYKRRSAEDEARKVSESRRKADDRRSYEDSRYNPSSQRKMSAQEEEAIRYLHKSRGQVEAEMSRPSPTRTSSRDYYGESRSSRKEPRPEAVRRSSARPKERTSTSGRDRDRAIPEIVDWSEHRSPPTFKHSSSSPANIEVPRAVPQRSFTESARDHRHVETSPPPPSFHRSSTMPSVPSSRRKEARPSGLRETMTPEHHTTPERDAFPSGPPPQSNSSRKIYHYPTPGGGVPIRPEDVGTASNHRTVLREPERHRARSPSPLSRPPIGANRPSEATKTQYVPMAAVPPPPMGRSSSSRNVSPVRVAEDRGRTRPSLYGEIGRTESEYGRSRGRQTSFSPSSVQYTQKYGPEDVRWAPRSRENEREYASKPSLGRQATYVY